MLKPAVTVPYNLSGEHAGRSCRREHIFGEKSTSMGIFLVLVVYSTLGGISMAESCSTDTPDTFNHTIEHLELSDVTCSQLVTSYPHVCYNHIQDTAAHLCCESCNAVRNETHEGCEYGDRRPLDCSHVEAQFCYVEDVERLCCGACKRHETMIPGCLYGDRFGAGACSIELCEVEENRINCCETCYLFGETTSGTTSTTELDLDKVSNSASTVYDVYDVTATTDMESFTSEKRDVIVWATLTHTSEKVTWMNDVTIGTSASVGETTSGTTSTTKLDLDKVSTSGSTVYDVYDVTAKTDMESFTSEKRDVIVWTTLTHTSEKVTLMNDVTIGTSASGGSSSDRGWLQLTIVGVIVATFLIVAYISYCLWKSKVQALQNSLYTSHNYDAYGRRTTPTSTASTHQLLKATTGHHPTTSPAVQWSPEQGYTYHTYPRSAYVIHV